MKIAKERVEEIGNRKSEIGNRKSAWEVYERCGVRVCSSGVGNWELGIGSKSESEDWGEEGEKGGFAVRQRRLLVPPIGVRGRRR